jgi:hypothetical protein
MTKYEILVASDKEWEKTITHFTDLYALRKAYGCPKLKSEQGLLKLRVVLYL